ncbi:MAG: hypothetical protein AUH85_13470 [Chloroflexi bacterium 13_1_40CM_4_68_4]|nr:MAG: hypothetical protein AUH85_13470 [Chloroflexi bacterium 13_1_40CM_4_68_4]
MSVAVANTSVARSPVNVAYRALWVAVIFDFLAFGVGFDLDRRWHATHPFEDFFSPPHLFIYSMHFLATMTLAYIAFTPSLRAVFGRTFRLFPLPFPVPGPIALAGGGFVVTALAGVFDGIWHTVFGLDETLWSFPHSMLGAGIFVAFVGIAACRWAIREETPIGIWSALVFGLLLFETAAQRFTGPIGTNLSPEVLDYISRIPVLAASPPFQHTIRIELAYDLHRLNPLFVPLASLSTGMTFALLRSFDRRPLVTLVLSALASWTSTLVPYLIPGIVLVIGGETRTTSAIWWLAGFGFAATAAAIWFGTIGSVIVGTLLFQAGVWLGRLVWSVVERPERGRVLAFVILFGIAYPALTGIVDLALRARVP